MGSCIIIVGRNTAAGMPLMPFSRICRTSARFKGSASNSAVAAGRVDSLPGPVNTALGRMDEIGLRFLMVPPVFEGSALQGCLRERIHGVSGSALSTGDAPVSTAESIPPTRAIASARYSTALSACSSVLALWPTSTSKHWLEMCWL